MSKKDDDIDLFDDAFVSARSKSTKTLDQIEQELSNSSYEDTSARWKKNTRKKTRATPESNVKSKIRNHLIKVYHAKVLRTNAGAIVDQHGNTVYLGETGQSDLHAIVPLQIGNLTIGIFAAIEVKAKKPSQKTLENADNLKDKRIRNQSLYISQIKKKGGIGFFADCTEDVDEAILNKMIEIQSAIMSMQEEL